MTNKPTEFEGGLNKPENPIVKPDPPVVTPPIAETKPPVVTPPIAKPPVAEQLPADTPRIKKMKEISVKLGEIIAEYSGESNIPVNHIYWTLKNEINALRSQPEPTA